MNQEACPTEVSHNRPSLARGDDATCAKLGNNGLGRGLPFHDGRS